MNHRNTFQFTLAVLLATSLAGADEPKPKPEDVKCSWSQCEVQLITDKGKIELEKSEKKEDLEIRFRSGTTNDQLKSVSKVPWATAVKISGKDVSDLTPIAGLKKLKKLDLYGLDKITTIAPLASSTELEELSLYMTKVSDIAPVKNMKKLKVLDLYATKVTDLAPIKDLKELTYLNLYMLEPKDYSPIKGLTKLETIWVQFSTLKDTSLFTAMTALKSFQGSWSKELADISGLKNATQLESLELDDCPVTNLDAAAGMLKLERLRARSTEIKSIAPLAKITTLRWVDIGKTKVSDLSPLAASTNLDSLDLRETKVTTLAPLAKLANLDEVILTGTAVKDLTPLLASAKAKKLRKLELSKGSPKSMWAALEKENPKLVVELN